MLIKERNETTRRLYGDFFTPLPFAQKAIDLLEETLGKKWWKTGNYRLWDMAAGTGNLQYHLPKQALQYCYLSTLYEQDVNYCKYAFPQATSFQYDYLNDDIQPLFANTPTIQYQKLPQNLQQDLQNPNLQWIILLNPPFVTSQISGTNPVSKTGVTDTALRKIMHQQALGEVSREIAMQFVFRIKKEFENKKTHLGLFYKLKHINSNNDKKLREHIFKFKFEKGFVFSSANFAQTSVNNAFPIGFMIWDLHEQRTLDSQKFNLQILNEDLQIIGTKKIRPQSEHFFLNKWIERPKNTEIFPPFKSAINIAFDNKDTRDRACPKFLCSLFCAGNDFQHQNLTAILSGPAASAGAFSVTPQNFEQAMVVHAVRRIPKANWLNDRDQFMQPKATLQPSFIANCTVWNLFSNSNQTVALQQIEYKNNIYDIKNQCFPFLLKDIKQWNIEKIPFKLPLLSTAENRFIAKWLSQNIGNLNNEARHLLEVGKNIYKLYFENMHLLVLKNYKINTWDAGWWQIRNTLTEANMGAGLFLELKNWHQQLSNILLQQIVEYGFIENNELNINK